MPFDRLAWEREIKILKNFVENSLLKIQNSALHHYTRNFVPIQ